MARVEIDEVVQSPLGAAVTGASVQVNLRSGGAATVYTTETGSAAYSNPLTTDELGRIQGWLEEGSYNLVVSYTGSSYTQPFEASVGGSRYIVANVRDARFGAKGDGATDDSAAFQAAADAVATLGSGFVYAPAGSYVVGNVNYAPNVGLVGDGFATVFIPASATQRMFTFTGTFGQDWLRCRGWRVLSTANRAYDVPIVKFVTTRSLVLEGIHVNVSGTGTLFAFDQVYSSEFRDSTLRTGRYTVPFEAYYSVQQQLDTFKFENVVVVGSMGGIVRGNYPGVTVSELHSFRFEGYKHVVQSEAVADRKQPLSETTLASGTAIGATTITGQAGSGASFAAGDPVAIGSGSSVEVNKVLSIATDTLTLAQPLVFAHSSGEQVLAHSVGLFLGPINMSLLRGCHFEGEIAGIMGSTGGCTKIEGTYCEAQELYRSMGAHTNLEIARARMHGDVTNSRNVVLKIPASNANGPTAVVLSGPFEQASGAPTVTPVEGTLTGKVYDWYDTQTSATVPRQVRNFTAGQEGNTMRQGLLDGVSVWREFHDGRKRFENVTEPQIVMESVLSGSSVAVQILMGSGTPEGNVAARVGSLFLRKDGGAATSLYVKETGTGNTGWVGK